MFRTFLPRRRPPPPEAEGWLLHLFGSKAARSGGVVRRRAADIERIVGADRFRDEIARRGWTAITDGRQVVVFCHAEGIRRLV